MFAASLSAFVCAFAFVFALVMIVLSHPTKKKDEQSPLKPSLRKTEEPCRTSEKHMARTLSSKDISSCKVHAPSVAVPTVVSAQVVTSDDYVAPVDIQFDNSDVTRQCDYSSAIVPSCCHSSYSDSCDSSCSSDSSSSSYDSSCSSDSSSCSCDSSSSSD